MSPGDTVHLTSFAVSLGRFLTEGHASEVGCAGFDQWRGAIDGRRRLLRYDTDGQGERWGD